MSIVAVSDVHLGYETCNKRDFDDFVDELGERDDVSHLVICGDFLDMWRRDMAGVVLENAAILTKLQNLQPKIEVHYVAGNHDYHIMYLSDKFGYQFSFHEKYPLTIAGINYRFLHGYEFDPFQNPIYFDALCYSTDELGDIMSEAWKMFISGRSWWRRILGFFRKGKAMEEMEKMLIKPKVRLKDIIDSVEKEACEERKAKEYLIFGHTHKPFVNKEENVANCGAWQSDASPPNTYIEIKDGKVALKIFKGEEITERLEC